MRNRLLITAAVAALAVAGATATAIADPLNSNDTSSSSDGSLATKKLKAALAKIEDAGAPSAVAQVRDGSEKWSKSVGNRSTGGDEKTKPNDQVRIGSLTKSMMSTIILQLSDEDKINVNDELDKYLPGLLPYDKPITIRQLMSHTSGVPDFFTDIYPSLRDGSSADLKTERLNEYTPEQIIKTATQRPLDFAPGSNYKYSNTGYYILGLVIEDITGDSVKDLVNDRVLKPTGLKHTHFPTGDENVISGDHPKPYFVGDDGDLIDTDKWSPSQTWAAGATVSTTSDVNKFFRAMFDGTLLPTKLRDEAFKLTEQSDNSYGLGIQAIPANCELIPGGTAYGHTGGTLGHSTLSFHSPDGKREMSLTYNLDDQMKPNKELANAINDFASIGLCNQAPSGADAKSSDTIDVTAALPNSGI